MSRALFVLAGLLFFGGSLAAQTTEERLRQLEEQSRALQQQLAAARSSEAEARLAELERRLEALAQELEALRHGEAAAPATAPRALGLAPAAAKVYRSEGGVSLGGYGEAIYTNFAARREDGRSSGKTDTADMLRNVLYVGYKFDGPFVFNSEVELEHAHTGKGGEVELEFAYADWLASPGFALRTGMVLVPLGLVNETHEPTTFLPARRSETESRILPSTWRELGVGAYGDLGPLSYRTYVLTGLDARKFSPRGLRDARQAGAKAKAESFAWVGRVDWTATPGLLAGVGLYLGEAGQGLRSRDGEKLRLPTRIAELHGEWKPGRATVRALYARATVGDAAALNRTLGRSGPGGVGKTLAGGYLELAYDLLSGQRKQLAPFLRFERIDTQKAVPRGFARDGANDEEFLTLGLAYQPIPQLVFKVDWQRAKNRAATGVNQLNLAFGYVF